VETLPTTGINPNAIYYALWALFAGLPLTYRRKLRQK
jgi:hypothetical protein